MKNFRGIIIGFITLFYLTFMCGLIITFVYFFNKFWAVLSIFLLTLMVQISTAAVIFNNDRKLEIKLCWLMVVVTLPLLGTLIFIWFGLRPFNVKKWREYINEYKNYMKFENYTFTNSFLKTNHKLHSLFAYNYSVSKSPVYINNSIKVIDDNIDFLKEVINLIRSAKKLIVLETYILKNSYITRIVITELLKKKKEGVEIFVLYDWVFGRRLKKYFVKAMISDGINVGVFNWPGFNIYKSKTNYRLHTKVLVIDNQKAIFGGSNYSDEYIMMNKKCNNFKDLNFIVSGEICNSLLVNFFNSWTSFTKKYNKISKIEWINIFNKLHKEIGIQKNNDKVLMQLTQSRPDLKEKTIEQTIVSLILQAKKSIYIAIPYLCPSKKIIDTLNYMALSGVDVRIITPGLRESKKILLNVNRSHYQDLIEGKCKIYEYNGFIHSKYIVVDDDISYIGSSNIDYRSLWINFETSILIHDKICNKIIKNIFFNNLLNSKEITNDNLINVFDKKDKFIIFFLRLIYPLI